MYINAGAHMSGGKRMSMLHMGRGIRFLNELQHVKNEEIKKCGNRPSPETTASRP